MDTQLGRALQVVRARGDAVGVIRLVERWIEQGSPPLDARVAEARALLDLKLADRAWVRLREVTEQQADHVEALLLMGEMFVLRGWPQRARRLVERLDQLSFVGERLEGLRAGSLAPGAQPPADAREIERAGAPEAVLALAEAYLLSGSVIRAQALLERLARADAPPPRVAALLWGIRGEFLSRNQTLAELVTELAPEAPATGPAAPFGGFLRVPEGEPNDPETAEVSRHHGALDVEAAASFPQLFRLGGPSVGEEMGHDDEVTMAAVLARPGEIEAPPLREDTDPDAIRAPEGGDTQILQVISSGAGRRLGPVDGPMHERSEGAPGASLHRTLDLKAWQQEMGVGGDEVDDEDYLEEEDQDLVVLTRRGDRPAPAPEPPAPERRAPVEVFERPVAPPALLSAPTLIDEDTPHAQQVPQERLAPPPKPAPVDDADLDLEPPARRVPWPALVLIGALVGLALFIGAVLAFGGMLGGGDVESTSRQLSGGDPVEVAALSAELGARQRAAADPHVAAELALTEAFRFAFIDGDPGASAAAALALSSAEGPLRDTAEALWRYGRGDPSGAMLLLGDAGGDDLAVGLAARVSIDTKRPQAAVRRLGERAGAAEGWLAAVRVEALADAGELDAARAAVASAPPSPWLQLAQGRGAWSGLSERQRVALLGGLVAAPPAPVLAGQAGVALAQLHEAQGRLEAAREAWALALQADPYSAPALVRAAAVRLERADPATAAELMARCLQVHPSSAECRRGRVQALIAQGQHGRARREVESWADQSLDAGLLLPWVLVAAGDPDRKLAPVRAARSADAASGPLGGAELASYILALELQGKSGGADAMQRALDRLQRSDAPLDRALAVASAR